MSLEQRYDKSRTTTLLEASSVQKRAQEHSKKSCGHQSPTWSCTGCSSSYTFSRFDLFCSINRKLWMSHLLRRRIRAPATARAAPKTIVDCTQEPHDTGTPTTMFRHFLGAPQTQKWQVCTTPFAEWTCLHSTRLCPVAPVWPPSLQKPCICDYMMFCCGSRRSWPCSLLRCRYCSLCWCYCWYWCCYVLFLLLLLLVANAVVVVLVLVLVLVLVPLLLLLFFFLNLLLLWPWWWWRRRCLW